jgi:hypothetical protein
MPKRTEVRKEVSNKRLLTEDALGLFSSHIHQLFFSPLKEIWIHSARKSLILAYFF